jgi:beta-lactamase superfamily II metal-dependent hydrolase
MSMDVLTLHVDQGSLVGIRTGNEGIIVDAHMPQCDHVTPEEIKQSLSVYFRGIAVRGLILTGFDADHAHAEGVEWILSQFTPDWIMYPKYFKDTDCASDVFRSIEKHEKHRILTTRPLTRHSVRLDKLDSRQLTVLGSNFTIELFSPHLEDMDSSNNCSIVAKITGTDSSGFRYLVTGDTEAARWETINRLFGSQLEADVMAAAHHGAITGTYPKAVMNVSPNTVLISAGIGSQYAHPHGAAIRVYQAIAKHVWATNAGGEACNLLTRRNGSDFNTRVFSHAAVAA